MTHVYLVTTTDRAESVIRQLRNSEDQFSRCIKGVAIIDDDLRGKEIREFRL